MSGYGESYADLKVADAVLVKTANGTAVAVFEQDSGDLIVAGRLAPLTSSIASAELIAASAAYMKARADR